MGQEFRNRYRRQLSRSMHSSFLKPSLNWLARPVKSVALILLGKYAFIWMVRWVSLGLKWKARARSSSEIAFNLVGSSKWKSSRERQVKYPACAILRNKVTLIVSSKRHVKDLRFSSFKHLNLCTLKWTSNIISYPISNFCEQFIYFNFILIHLFLNELIK